MRGAISYHEYLDLAPYERTAFEKFLTSRMEIEAKRKNPIY